MSADRRSTKRNNRRSNAPPKRKYRHVSAGDRASTGTAVPTRPDFRAFSSHQAGPGPQWIYLKPAGPADFGVGDARGFDLRFKYMFFSDAKLRLFHDFVLDLAEKPDHEVSEMVRRAVSYLVGPIHHPSSFDPVGRYDLRNFALAAVTEAKRRGIPLPDGAKKAIAPYQLPG